MVLIVLRHGFWGKQLGKNESDLNYNKVTYFHHYSNSIIQTIALVLGELQNKQNKTQTQTENKQKVLGIFWRYASERVISYSSIIFFYSKPFIHQLPYTKLIYKQWAYSFEQN